MNVDNQDQRTLRLPRGALAAAVLGAVALGCPANEPAADETKQEKAAATAEAPKEEPKGDAGRVEVRLEVGDGLKYSKNRIEVPAGATVVLTLAHTGKMDKAAMGHNFVLLKKGTDMAKFAQAAMAAAGSGYIPKDMEGAVIAHTEVLGGGESDTIEFEAPAPGEYQYLCSFPGHYSAMNGVLVVK